MPPVNSMDYSGKDAVLDVIKREAKDFFALVDDPKNWNVQTRCTEWETRDLVGHMIDVTEGYLTRWDSARKNEPRDSAGLLVMSIGVGAVHVTLGLILGVWEAIRSRSRNHLLERGGMLLGLIGLFFVIGVLTDYLPKGLMTPAIVGMIIGIVLLGASLGWLGILMGPIEFISLIGNILSYLRIAAIGLASVALARVANEMAGMVGNLIVGVIVAVLIHALNLVMGAFSPTIHSLRLHYVEFFRKFYESGGRPYQPFSSQ